MNSPLRSSSSMLPVSGRIPEDLYQWLSTASLEGATTMSDKLRVAVAALQRLQSGDTDYNGALEMHRDLLTALRRQLQQLEPDLGHSEVLMTILEHIPAIAATMTSAQVSHATEARRLEDRLVQRCLLLTESLLRQAITRQARAYDPDVLNKHSSAVIELSTLIQRPTTAHQEGN